MMKYPYLDRVVLQAYIWRRRFFRPRPVEFTTAFRQAARILVCLPTDPSEAGAALPVLTGLASCLRSQTMTLLAPESVVVPDDAPACPVQVLTIEPDDRRWIGLPTAAFVTRVRGDGLDAVIDLNPRLDVLIASLCSLTGARLRVCFRSPYRDLFFNVQISVPMDHDAPEDASETTPEQPLPRHAEDRPPSSPYTRFLHTLEGLMGQPS